ncbi:hypothetical protein B0I35DRAFT_446335 [Stachybotrys elegans]|uniref:Ankyrin repeat-containing protein n=1 Tax=Stachybotrys elegans TaxID=80388 RepID=A0A8K0WJ65_9HYPO|nr:hypothetical protein B0I35DRAFT_446335 [Stachybotrys elegans]
MAFYGVKLPFRPTENEQKEYLQDPSMEDNVVKEILGRARAGDMAIFSLSPGKFTQIIDPDTGDSLLHVAVRLASLEAVNTIMACFRRGKRVFSVWSRHALLVHQNHDGDTALHIAARSGNQLLLTMLFRYLCSHWSAECPEEVEMDDGPPEKDIYPEDIDESASAPALLVILTKNRAGRDAAAEARQAGHDDLAQWLEDVMQRYDPDKTRRTDEGVAELIALVKAEHGHDAIEQRRQLM